DTKDSIEDRVICNDTKSEDTCIVEDKESYNNNNSKDFVIILKAVLK
ncbi:16248_t:CDS:2, partial [Racocetra persica]